MLNSRFELSKIEKNTRVEREICLATLENREWKENLFLPLSKIESRKRIVSCHSRKSRVEREMGTIKFSRSREKFLFLLSIFLSRARLLSMPVSFFPPNPCTLSHSLDMVDRDIMDMNMVDRDIKYDLHMSPKPPISK